MRNTTLSRLALLGLASVSSIAFAANTVTGEIRFDARFTTSQKGSSDTSVSDSLEKADSLFVSRARLDIAGDVAKNWTYGIRLEQNEAENLQIGLDPSGTSYQGSLPVVSEVELFSSLEAKIARAYVQWAGIDGIDISIGRIGAPDISSDRLYYKPFIGSYPNNMALGAIVNYTGDQAGFSIDGKAGPVGYSFGVWKQTDLRKLESLAASTTIIDAGSGTSLTSFETSFLSIGDITTSNFDTKNIRFGYGGRLNFANKMNATTSYGVGLGWNQAPLNMPIAIATVSTFGATVSSVSTAPVYGVATFNNLTNFAADASAVFGAFQLNLGYQNQTVKADSSQSYGTASVANAVFNQDGKATSFWVEGGYLIMGDSYKFNDARAVVEGVKLRENQAGLELVARYGTESRRNVLALVNSVGFSDFSTVTSSDPVTATTNAAVLAEVVSLASTDKYLLLAVDNTSTPGSTGTTLVLNDEKAFEEKANGFAIGLNYYVTENAVVKAEYEMRNNEFNRYYSSSAEHDSLYSNSVSTLRLRADFSF